MFISYFRHFDYDKAIAQCTNWKLYVGRDDEFDPILVLEMDGTKEVICDADGFWQGYQTYSVFRDFTHKAHFNISERCYHAFEEIVSKVQSRLSDTTVFINLGEIQSEVVVDMQSTIKELAEKYPDKT